MGRRVVADIPGVFANVCEPVAGVVWNFYNPSAGSLGNVGPDDYVVVFHVLPPEPANLCAPQPAEPPEDQEGFHPGVGAFVEKGFQFLCFKNFWFCCCGFWSVCLFCCRDPGIQVALALGESEKGDQCNPVVQSSLKVFNGVQVVVKIIYGDSADFFGDIFRKLFQVVNDGVNVPGATSRFLCSRNKFIGQLAGGGGRESFFQVGVMAFVELQEFADWNLCQLFWFVSGGCRPTVTQRINDERCGIQHIPQIRELFALSCWSLIP